MEIEKIKVIEELKSKVVVLPDILQVNKVIRNELNDNRNGVNK